MTLPFKEPLKYYQLQGFYWMVGEQQLVQFTADFFNEWKPGSDLYYNKRKELLRLKPINNSDGEAVMVQLLEKIKYLVEDRPAQINIPKLQTT
jgi:hypothetical protein